MSQLSVFIITLFCFSYVTMYGQDHAIGFVYSLDNSYRFIKVKPNDDAEKLDRANSTLISLNNIEKPLFLNNYLLFYEKALKEKTSLSIGLGTINKGIKIAFPIHNVLDPRHGELNEIMDGEIRIKRVDRYIYTSLGVKQRILKGEKWSLSAQFSERIQVYLNSKTKSITYSYTPQEEPTKHTNMFTYDYYKKINLNSQLGIEYNRQVMENMELLLSVTSSIDNFSSTIKSYPFYFNWYSFGLGIGVQYYW